MHGLYEHHYVHHIMKATIIYDIIHVVFVQYMHVCTSLQSYWRLPRIGSFVILRRLTADRLTSAIELLRLYMAKSYYAI